MGDAAWFDHHGFEQARAMAAPTLRLDIRVNRPTPVFEFLEPVVVELKLMNISATPQVVDENILTTLDGITIALKRQGSPARQFLPFAQYCMKAAAKVLQPNEAMYASVYVTAGLNGVDVAEPGRYLLQAALHTPEGDIVSKPLTLRVATPRGMEEEVVAQDFFSDKVSRVLAFDGSRVLPQANQVLRDVVERLGDRRVARHARIPLGLSMAEPARVLAIGAGAGDGDRNRVSQEDDQDGVRATRTGGVGAEGRSDEPSGRGGGVARPRRLQGVRRRPDQPARSAG